MIEIFLQTLPFFLLIGIGYVAAVTRLFGPDATAYLTKFVFYFALSAMLFRFSSTLAINDIFDLNFGLAYLLGCLVVYAVFAGVALAMRKGWSEAAIEGQCTIIGNNGFLALPLLISLMGEAAAAPALFVLAIDLVFFGSLAVMIITARDPKKTKSIAKTNSAGAAAASPIREISNGSARNPLFPMIVHCP